jgi:hypothetical protein
MIIGETHELDRNLDTDKFQCPICSYATSTIRSIQKHCKDHALDSTVKRASSCYHPYATVANNVTGDRTSDITNSIGARHVQDSNTMDIEGWSLCFQFINLYINNPSQKTHHHEFAHKAHHSVQLPSYHHSTFRFTWFSRFSYACSVDQHGLL